MTPGEVAHRFNVHIETVRSWADDGKLACFRTPGGQRRFRVEDVEAFFADAATVEPETAAS